MKWGVHNTQLAGVKFVSASLSEEGARVKFRSTSIADEVNLHEFCVDIFYARGCPPPFCITVFFVEVEPSLLEKDRRVVLGLLPARTLTCQ